MTLYCFELAEVFGVGLLQVVEDYMQVHSSLGILYGIFLPFLYVS
jgi:hypothetical protein